MTKWEARRRMLHAFEYAMRMPGADPSFTKAVETTPVAIMDAIWQKAFEYFTERTNEKYKDPT